MTITTRRSRSIPRRATPVPTLTPWSFADGISPSGLSLFQKCREQFRLCYKENLEARYWSTAIHFGNACHHVLNQHYQSGVPGYAGDQQIEQWIKEYAEDNANSFDPTAKARQGVELTLGHATVIMQEYFLKWRTEDAARRIIRSERQFSVPWYTTKLNGTRDCEFSARKLPSGVWIEDTKTSSQMNESLIEDIFPLRMQFRFYMVAYYAQHGVMPKGIMLNQIRRPGLKQTDKDGTLINHLRRVRDDIRSRPDYYFLRMEARYSPKEVLQWADNQLTPMLVELHMWDEGKLPHYTNTEALVFNHQKSDYFDAIVNNDRSGLKIGTHWMRYRE